MEIALLPKSGLRIKSKQTTIALDPQDKATYAGILLLNKSIDAVTQSDDAILISGVGEYEIGGIKITGMRSESAMLYSLLVDTVEILIGNVQALERMHQKLKEHHIVIVDCESEGTAAFITSLATNVVIFYGEKSADVAASFGKENVKSMNKYSSTKDKLPTEVETILLATSA